jgi:S1 RNA binding domain protein
MPYGAFVSLGGGKSGMIHISQVSNGFIKDIHDVLKEGQDVRVKVLSVENGKVSLTLRFTEEVKPSFEDMMASFMKSSDERNSELSSRIGESTGRRRNSKKR